jgi:DNA-binding Lrp family transcriptional regulator
MDEKERLLLTYLQNGLPLTPRPFDVWSAKIGADTAEILLRIQRLKREGAFEGVRAILDPRALHYQGAWVAVRIENEFESRLEVFLQHPGVIYGCEREHEFNAWFFITAPAGHDLELHVRCLEKLAGVPRCLFLPVSQELKGIDLSSSLDAGTFFDINERFDKRQTKGSSGLMARIGQEPSASAEDTSKDWLSTEEIGMIRQLQEPFPLTDEPFRKIALDLGITEAQAVERIKLLSKRGCLKRIGSFLKPVAVLASPRTLVVWQIPEEKLERIGFEITGSKEVLYADRRPAFAEFPYSLYTMVRGGTSEELEGLIRRIQDRIGMWPCRALITKRELKKEPVKYFPKELDVWWRASCHVVETAFN